MFITIEVPDCENIAIDVNEENNQLLFSAVASGQAYELQLPLFAAVSKADSKWNTKGRSIILNLSKKDQDAEWWPRLTQHKMVN